LHAGLFPLIGFLEQFDNRLARRSLFQKSPEDILLQIAENNVHGLEMLLGLIFRG
jgi:hypothetical protein